MMEGSRGFVETGVVGVFAFVSFQLVPFPVNVAKFVVAPKVPIKPVDVFVPPTLMRRPYDPGVELKLATAIIVYPAGIAREAFTNDAELPKYIPLYVDE
jgi:hypothetical protein